MITLQGNPVAKPRMTQRDKFAQRDCVLQYRAWADLLRLKAFKKNQKLELHKPVALFVTAFFPTSKELEWGKPHTMACDIDNIAKGVADALFLNDKFIWRLVAEKYWCRADMARVGVEWV